MSKKCPKCETTVISEARFCSLCGFEFDMSAAPIPANEPNESAPENSSDESESSDDIFVAETVEADSHEPNGKVTSESAETSPKENLEDSDREQESADAIVAEEVLFDEPRTGSPFSAKPVNPLKKKDSVVHYATLVLLPEYENYKAVGGAVGSIVVGALAIIGAFFTPYVLLNCVVGLFMSLWGYQSKEKRLALIGAGLNVVAMVIPILWFGF